MKAIVDKKTCNGCTICNITCPEVFMIEEDGKAKAHVSLVPGMIEQICIEAADECPVNAITIEYEHVNATVKDTPHLQVPALVMRAEAKQTESYPVKKVKVFV